MSNHRDHWPWWVRLGLWGLPTRASALSFFWLCTLIAAGGLAATFVQPVYLLGASAVLPAAWYYLAIAWVDRHSWW